MRPRTQRAAFSALSAILLGILVPAVSPEGSVAAQAESYRGRLSALPRGAGANPTGVGQFTAILQGNQLTVTGTFTGLSSPATGANLHLGRPAEPGPVAHAIQATGGAGNAAGSVTGTVTLTAAQVAALRASSLYVQVTSQGNTAGEVRGWIFPLAVVGPAPAVPAGMPRPSPLASFRPATDEVLRNPDPADWPMIRRDYHGTSYSPLDQINTGNVDELQLAWVWSMNNGSSEPAPIVYGGVMYLINPGNVIQALDARTGDLLWQAPDEPEGTQDMRNIAIYEDKIIQITTDAGLRALDARTGDLIWETTTAADTAAGFSNSSGPIVADGRVIAGLASCQDYIEQKCYVSAYDADTGALQWRFNTIASAGEPGGDTWGDLDNIYRAGGETWITGSYDPELRLTYWGTAQAKPWAPMSRNMSIFDPALYTSSTIAVDVDTGELEWYYQHVPGEALDLDEVFERVLVDRDGRRLVFSLGKHGILWKNDRVTGEFLGYGQATFQNAFSSIDPRTGAVTYRQDIIDAQLNQWVSACPSSAGGKDWHSMSYHPPTGLMIAPLSQTCLENRAAAVALEPGGGGLASSRRFFEMPGTDGNLGKIGAYNVTTMQEAWSFEQRASYHTGVITTAGNVAFVGDLDRWFRAHDVRTGEVLWETRLGTSVQGHPLTFAVDGKQYVAVTAALGGTSPRQVPAAILREIAYPNTGNAVYVFALPD